MKLKLSMLFGIVFFFAACFVCFGENSPNEPVLTFTDATFDFGEAVEGTVVSHDYLFTNTGKAPLEISEVRPTCGCTVAGDFTRKAGPGEKGKISLSFRTQGYDGHVTKSIIVKTNMTKQPETYLTLQGNVKALVSINPKSLSLGNIDDTKGIPLSGTFTITNSSDKPLKVLELVPPGPNTKATLTAVRDGFEYKVSITVLPPYKERQNTEWVTLKTDSEKVPTLSLSYSYYATPASKVNPIAIMVSSEGLKKGIDQDVTVECREGFSMSVEELKASDSKITFSLAETTKGRMFKLRVHIPAGYKLDEKNFPSVSFRLKGVPNEPAYSIPIYKM